MAMRVPNQNTIVVVWRPRSDPTGLVIVQLGAFFLEREFWIKLRPAAGRAQPTYLDCGRKPSLGPATPNKTACHLFCSQ